MKKIFRKAFNASLPVLAGYLTMGFAAGVLLSVNGGISFTPFWGALTSAVFVSGPLQFLIVDWLVEGTSLFNAALLAFCLNVRYSTYGISLLERFNGIGFWKKFYLIWGITDETYAIETSCEYKPGRASTFFCLFLTGLDHLYWITGVTAGTIAGMLFKSFNLPSNGIDFAMTALFLVIITDQLREKANRFPALIGLSASLITIAVLCLIKGPLTSAGLRDMFIPSMVLILVSFLVFRKRLDVSLADSGVKQ